MTSLNLCRARKQSIMAVNPSKSPYRWEKQSICSRSYFQLVMISNFLFVRKGNAGMSKKPLNGTLYKTLTTSRNRSMGVLTKWGNGGATVSFSC